eukprot:COSAG05_NODE_17328_length_327_cov_0.912281_2_plen_56_part_00
MLAAVAQNGHALEHVDASLHKDREIVLASRTKKIKQLEIFKKWKTGSRGGIKRKR